MFTYMCMFQVCMKRCLQTVCVFLHLTGECKNIYFMSTSMECLATCCLSSLTLTLWCVFSLHGRSHGEMQSVRTPSHSHLWWSFVWVSWRLQLPSGWGLQPSFFHSAGWVAHRTDFFLFFNLLLSLILLSSVDSVIVKQNKIPLFV